MYKNVDYMFNESCGDLTKLLKLDTIVSPLVLISAIIDNKYARNLFVCKDDDEYLTYLLNTPPVKQISVEYSSQDFLQKTKETLKRWEISTHIQEKKGAYLEKFDTYFKGDDSCNSYVNVNMEDFKEVYLDYNATTFVRDEIRHFLDDLASDKHSFFNPSSTLVQGKYISKLILDSRKKIGKTLHVNSEEIYFTGSGSEANNLAIKGVAFNHLEKKGHLITSKIEHPSVLRVMEYLETIGFEVSYLDVDKDGIVKPESVNQAIRKDTILVAIMAANNEIGTINPIIKIGKICKERHILFMVDAIQAYGKIPLNPKEMGISLLSVSGHKIYAPKGTGVLYIEEGVSLVPQVHGGDQELDLRAGTENVNSIIAFGKAAELIFKEMGEETIRLTELREYFFNGLKNIDDKIIINGSTKYRIPNNLSIGFPGISSGILIRSLNKIGISVSASSACSSKKTTTSHVLTAIGADTENYGTIRFSFGLKTNNEDLDYVLKCLDEIFKTLRN
jgi:cysteine desulfurase